MAKLTATATGPRGPREKRAPVIDAKRHADGLRDAAAQVRELVARLTAGKEWLFSRAASDPDRPEAERLWSDLVTRCYSALREAYARFALLRIALGDGAALDLWSAEMPIASAMEDVGIPQLIAYWSGRRDNPEWMTQEEGRLLVQAIWPPQGTDPIGQGLEGLVDEPPF